MKVLRNTPQQLIVEDRPWFFSLLLAAMFLGMLVAVGSTMGEGRYFLAAFVFLVSLAVFAPLAYFLVQRVQIVFDAPRNLLEIRRRTLRGYRVICHELSDFERAITETSRGDGSETHRTTLILARGMSAGKHPMTPAYSSGNGAHRITAAINDWNRARLDSASRPP